MPPRRQTTRTAEAAAILNKRLGNGDARRERIDLLKHNIAIGAQIHDARKAAGLTQTQLAERIGTTQSVISELEAAEYEGHSLSMLRRIAAALNLHVQVRFVPRNDNAA